MLTFLNRILIPTFVFGFLRKKFTNLLKNLSWKEKIYTFPPNVLTLIVFAIFPIFEPRLFYFSDTLVQNLDLVKENKSWLVLLQ